jgi:hypothetical protein
MSENAKISSEIKAVVLVNELLGVTRMLQHAIQKYRDCFPDDPRVRIVADLYTGTITTGLCDLCRVFAPFMPEVASENEVEIMRAEADRLWRQVSRDIEQYCE